MGTPEFAVPSLRSLISSKKHEVVAVFSQKPKPKGRGYLESFSPVHMLANEHSVKVYTPETLRSDESQELICSLEADIIVVVAYGFIIPKPILLAKKYGCLNIHPSKLPRFRGAAPIQRTIMAGDKTTAVCIMQMDAGLDTGDILLSKEIDISPRANSLTLSNECAIIGADLLIKVLDNIDDIKPVKQTDDGLVYANKLAKDEGKINWTEPAYDLDCKIRAFFPWPGSYFEYKGQNIKILEACYENISHSFEPGYVIDNQLSVACGSGVLKLIKLQRPGKNPLLVKDFLMGSKISVGEIL